MKHSEQCLSRNEYDVNAEYYFHHSLRPIQFLIEWVNEEVDVLTLIRKEPELRKNLNS